MLGSVGYFSSFVFVDKIYSAVKAEQRNFVRSMEQKWNLAMIKGKERKGNERK